MATKVSIEEYVTDVIGSTVTLTDNAIMAGMEDVIRKIETLQPQLLELFRAESAAIANIPLTLHDPSLGVVVFRDEDIAIRRPNKAHITNKLSLLYDKGETAYYYIIGDKLYIEPFKPTRYTYKVVGVAYGVSNGSLTWPRRLAYPLALYCTHVEIGKEYMAAVSAIRDDIATLPLSAIDQSDMARVAGRLAGDDTELAGAELAKIKTKLEAVAIQGNIEGVRVQRIQMRVETATALLHKYMSAKATYSEFFGIMQGEQK